MAKCIILPLRRYAVTELSSVDTYQASGDTGQTGSYGNHNVRIYTSGNVGMLLISPTTITGKAFTVSNNRIYVHKNVRKATLTFTWQGTDTGGSAKYVYTRALLNGSAVYTSGGYIPTGSTQIFTMSYEFSNLKNGDYISFSFSGTYDSIWASWSNISLVQTK